MAESNPTMVILPESMQLSVSQVDDYNKIVTNLNLWARITLKVIKEMNHRIHESDHGE